MTIKECYVQSGSQGDGRGDDFGDGKLDVVASRTGICGGKKHRRTDQTVHYRLQRGCSAQIFRADTDRAATARSFPLSQRYEIVEEIPAVFSEDPAFFRPGDDSKRTHPHSWTIGWLEIIEVALGINLLRRARTHRQ